MKDHRKNVRFRSEEVLDCYNRNGHFEAEILDVSRSGIRIGCLEDLPLGVTILIQHRELTRIQIPVKAVVRWKRPGPITEIGLEFLETKQSSNSQWVGELFPDKAEFAQKSEQRRVAVRAEVALAVVTEDGALEGETLDLSATGAKFHLGDKMADRGGLLLCLPSSVLRLQARVVRAEQDQGQWIHSVCFEDYDPETSATLSSFVAEAVR